MKLGILGGTFNPIHNAHLIIAEEVREALQLDKIFFIPTYTPPHKEIHPESKIDDEHRINIVKKAIENNPYFELCNYEIEMRGVSYTYKTLKHLYETLRIDGKIKVIIGADLIPELHTWHKYKELINICDFTVLKRGSLDLGSYKSRYPFIKIVKSNVSMNLSSTEIRNRIKKNRSIKYLVPNQVEEYIIKNKLYHSN